MVFSRGLGLNHNTQVPKVLYNVVRKEERKEGKSKEGRKGGREKVGEGGRNYYCSNYKFSGGKPLCLPMQKQFIYKIVNFATCFVCAIPAKVKDFQLKAG